MSRRREVAGRLGTGDDDTNAPGQDGFFSNRSTSLMPSSSAWYGRELDRIEDDADAIIEGLRPLWHPARRGGAATVMVVAGLSELAGLYARRRVIEREVGI